MKLLLLVALAAFVSAGTLPDYSEFNPVYGYLTRIGIPEAERIRKAEEAYLKSLWSRIIGGSPARPAQIPFQVGLIADITGQTGRGICGGSVLTNNRVLTAAHCWFDGRNRAWRFEVVLGSHLIFSGGNRVLTTSVTMHPNWTPSLLRNDIAIINLPNRVPFTSAISAIALPTGAQLNDNFSGSQATVSGFGLRDGQSSVPNNQFLSFASVNVIANNVCNVAYPSVIQNHHICTSTRQGAGPNRGDSGGPLIVTRGGRPILIGVVSFGSALPLSLPSVYARVTSFNNFIRQNI